LPGVVLPCSFARHYSCAAVTPLPLLLSASCCLVSERDARPIRHCLSRPIILPLKLLPIPFSEISDTPMVSPWARLPPSAPGMQRLGRLPSEHCTTHRHPLPHSPPQPWQQLCPRRRLPHPAVYLPPPPASRGWNSQVTPRSSDSESGHQIPQRCCRWRMSRESVSQRPTPSATSRKATARMAWRP